MNRLKISLNAEFYQKVLSYRALDGNHFAIVLFLFLFHVFNCLRYALTHFISNIVEFVRHVLFF